MCVCLKTPCKNFSLWDNKVYLILSYSWKHWRRRRMVKPRAVAGNAEEESCLYMMNSKVYPVCRSKSSEILRGTHRELPHCFVSCTHTLQDITGLCPLQPEQQTAVSTSTWTTDRCVRFNLNNRPLCPLQPEQQTTVSASTWTTDRCVRFNLNNRPLCPLQPEQQTAVSASTWTTDRCVRFNLNNRPLCPLQPEQQTAVSASTWTTDRCVRFNLNNRPLCPLQPEQQTAVSASTWTTDRCVRFNLNNRPLCPLQPEQQTAVSASTWTTDCCVCFNLNNRPLCPLQPEQQTAVSASTWTTDRCVHFNLNNRPLCPLQPEQQTAVSEQQTIVVTPVCFSFDCLIGLVDKASASSVEDPGFKSCNGIFLGWVIPVTSKLDTPVATLPSTWHYRVSTGTDWPVSVYCDWMRR